MSIQKKAIKLIAIMSLFALLLTACNVKKQETAVPVPAQTAAPSPAPTDVPAPVPKAVAIVAPTASAEPVDLSAYVGYYANDSYDTVAIDIDDSGFMMSISLYRLASLEEGTISASPKGIVFKTIDPAGDPMTVSFYPDGDGYALRIDESTWALLEPGTVVTGLKRTTREAIEGSLGAPDEEQEASAQLGPDGEERGDLIDPADLADAPRSHYVFQPKVCSVYMEEVFGKDMCEAWSNLVDAVLAGKNTFACKDQYTYDWTMGQFPEHCLPILPELIDYAWDRERSVIDGVASFTWLVPPEEAKARIEEFGAQIEGMLNEIFEDDYSDFEKALALYDYFSRTYQYDYDTYWKMNEAYVDYTSCYRFFQTGIGICHEISSAYSYLLLQAGVQATTMSGNRTYDKAGHQWSFVRINGKNYHIDPTYGLGTGTALCYFMMTDEQRQAEDSYDPATFYAVSHYSREHAHPDYTADDDTFRPLWDLNLETFFHDTHTVLCPKEEGYYGEWTYFEFDYSGY